MKSKLNDAELIAEAYSKVEPLEVQEEMIGALAGGLAKGAGAVAKGVGAVAKGTGKALVSAPAKKIYKGAGKAVKKTAETVGGAALGAVGGAAEGAAKAVSGVVQGAVEGTVGAVQGAVDGATGGVGKAAKGAVGMEDGEHKEGNYGQTSIELKKKLSDALEKGDIDDEDAMDIRQMERKVKKVEDAEHAAPEEVDM